MCVALWLALPSGAVAGPLVDSVSVSRDPQGEFFDFRWETNDALCGLETCPASLQVRYRGRRAPVTQRDDTIGQAFINWSCKRPGTHTWTLTVTGFDETGQPISENKKGTFRGPGRCGPWRPRYVNAGTASSIAADWGTEFVSSVRCRRTGRRVRARSNRWRCVVVHNNTYRVCATREYLSFRQRKRFGRTERDYTDHVGRSSCRSY